MKIYLFFTLILFVTGCASTPQTQQDLKKMYKQNRYAELHQIPAPKNLIGQWTATFSSGLVSYDIHPDGSIMMCAENPNFGEATAKLFQSGRGIAIVDESGLESAIKNVQYDRFDLIQVGIKTSYYTDKTGERCAEIFALTK